MFITPGFAQETVPADSELQTEALEHGAEPSGFPPFETQTYPSQLLWLAITFGLFYLFLSKVVLPRIGNILEVRRDRIAHDLDQAQRNREEADAAIAAYEQGLADARARAHGIAQEAQESAKADAEAQRKSTEAELEAKLSQAEARIATVRETAMRDVGTIAEDTASAIVEQLIGRKPEDAAVSAAVNQVR